MLPRARELGIEYMPGSSCYAKGGGENQIRLSYSFARDEQIDPGIEILGKARQRRAAGIGFEVGCSFADMSGVRIL